MATLPALIEEDVQRINAALNEFLSKSEAKAVLLTAEGGFVVLHAGHTGDFDVTAFGTLAANARYATQAVAELIDEPNFNTLYQQGERFSLLATTVDRYHTLIVLFSAKQSVGAMKYYAVPTIQTIADQLKKASARDPKNTIDPVSLNLSSTSELFRRK